MSQTHVFTDLAGLPQQVTTATPTEDRRLWVSMWGDYLPYRFEQNLGSTNPMGLGPSGYPTFDSFPGRAGSYERAVVLLANIRANP